MVTILKNRCAMCKGNKFLLFWYHCYYFTLSETYFIQLKTFLIIHPSYVQFLEVIHTENISTKDQ